MDRLKKKWGITSNLQFWVIMFVFSVTGMSVVSVRKPVFAVIGVTADTSWLIKFPLWLAVIFPSYQVLGLLWGALCGQWKSFWEFEKKTLRKLRILPREESAA